MRKIAALASSEIVGFASLAAGAAGRVTGIKPMMPPAKRPPRAAMCRSFTIVSFVQVCLTTSPDNDTGDYALLETFAVRAAVFLYGWIWIADRPARGLTMLLALSWLKGSQRSNG